MWEKKDKRAHWELTVLVLDRHKKPLTPTTVKHAWKLISSRRARIHKRSPLTIRIVDLEIESLAVKPSPPSSAPSPSAPAPPSSSPKGRKA
jgi:hypothetical protein